MKMCKIYKAGPVQNDIKAKNKKIKNIVSLTLKLSKTNTIKSISNKNLILQLIHSVSAHCVD